MDHNPFSAGLALPREAHSFALYIFGATGDLTRKKLMPALFSLFVKGHISRFRIIGFARRPWTREFFQDQAAEMIDLPEFAAYGEGLKKAFLDCLDYIQSSFDDPRGYGEIQEQGQGMTDKLYYLSTPPSSYQEIIEQLGQAGLAEENRGRVRIIVEKPIGHNLEEARAINKTLARRFNESQIFRIDHYLGKETVQNIMLLRFGNGLFEPVWNNRYVRQVQISVAEKIGVEGRGNYYESAGALRDMVQNHLFQLLCLTAMEPPNDLDPDSIRSEKVKILKSLRPMSPRETALFTIRGQYAAGYMDGKATPGYLEEPGVAPDSRTETFVALKLFLDTWRWSGVPFLLRTGKRLSRRVSEIAVQFKEPPLRLFSRSGHEADRNTLIIRIQPDEGITLNMNAKIPGYSTDSRPVNMNFAYGSAFGESPPEAYERLLLDALLGDATLYTRRDEIEASWEFITRILQGWEGSAARPYSYVPGSAGPEETKFLTQREGHRWRKL